MSTVEERLDALESTGFQLAQRVLNLEHQRDALVDRVREVQGQLDRIRERRKTPVQERLEAIEAKVAEMEPTPEESTVAPDNGKLAEEEAKRHDERAQ